MPPVEPPIPPKTTALAERGRGRSNCANRCDHEERPVRDARLPQLAGSRKYACANVSNPTCSSCSMDIVAVLTSTHTPTMAVPANMPDHGEAPTASRCRTDSRERNLTDQIADHLRLVGAEVVRYERIRATEVARGKRRKCSD